ncbi:MAG: RHS repeat-associated protein, partial [Parvicella sp.]
RDAQGNPMAIYDYAIDDSLQTSSFKLTERNIYGSSRVGQCVEEVEMVGSFFNANDPSHRLGVRKYELSNHLGNVLSVVSDRKIPIDADGNGYLDHYEADILYSADYSPFGVTLQERGGSKEVCEWMDIDTLIVDENDDFDNSNFNGWFSVGNSETDVTINNNGKLRARDLPGNLGHVIRARKFVTLDAGIAYDLNMDFNVEGLYDNNNNGNRGIVIRILDQTTGNVAYNSTFIAGNGWVSFTESFTATSSGSYQITIVAKRTSNFNEFNNKNFRIDNFKLSHTETNTELVCGENACDYRYGFQGQEKDDEIKGSGNSYDFGARMYDSRLGRFLSIDPLSGKHPELSPYHFVNNSPLKYIDPDGRDYIVTVDHETKTITVTANYYTTAKDSEEAQSAVNGWNGQNGKFEYVVGKGENAITYDLKFNLNVIDVTTLPNPDQNPEYEMRFDAYYDDKSGAANTYSVVEPGTLGTDNAQTENMDQDDRGASRIFVVKGKQALRRTGSHEVGHTLGLGHWFGGLMKAGGYRLDTDTAIKIGMISMVLYNAEIGELVSKTTDYQNEKPAGDPKVTTTETGTSPEAFKDGKVKLKKKKKKKQKKK